MKKIRLNFFGECRALIFVALTFCGLQVHANDSCDISVKDAPYNAAGNGSADDTAEILAAVSAAATLSNATICFPSAVGYLVSSTINIPSGMSVIMDAPLLFSGSDSQPGMIIGEPGVSNGLRQFRLNVKKTAFSSWSNEDSVGITVHNAIDSKLEITRSEGFTIGLKLVGSGKGLAHNRFELGYLVANKIGLDITNADVGAGYGYVNENIFIKGRFGAYSNVNTGSSRYGVRFSVNEASRANNNLFLQPSFELLQAYIGSPAEAVPVLMENGMLNRFESCRDEGNNAVFARVLNNSQLNEFDVGRGGKPYIEDSSTQNTTYASSRQSRINDLASAVIFNTGNLAVRAKAYDNFGNINVAGVHLVTSVSADARKFSSELTVSNNYLQVPNNRGVGVFVDTSVYKRFVLRRGVEPGYGGRVNVRAYDASGNVLTSTAIGGLSAYRSSFGGGYYEGVDNDKDRYFTLPDEVKKIAVYLTGGTAPLRINSFSVVSVDGGSPALWVGYEEAIPGANLAAEVPSGSCSVGAIRFNAEPGANEYTGWICTNSSGLWAGFGHIP